MHNKEYATVVSNYTHPSSETRQAFLSPLLKKRRGGNFLPSPCSRRGTKGEV
jgi:hypothetical protein